MRRSLLMRISALLIMVAVPASALFDGEARLVPFLAMPLIVLGGPMLMDLRGGADPESDGEDDSDSDDGPGGNLRPGHGPTTPSGPVGELPLEFSSPGGGRLRGSRRQRVSDPERSRPRRQPHRPSPAPRRVPARPHH